LVSLLVVIGLLSIFDAKAGASPFMRQQAALGKWIAHRFGPGKTIGGCIDDMRILAYYAKGQPRVRITLANLNGGSAAFLVQRYRPDVLIIGDRWAGKGDWTGFEYCLACESQPSYYRVPADQLPSNCRDTIVLVSDAAEP
jgi:hypothetical protein